MIDYTEFIELVNNSDVSTRFIFMVSLVVITVAIGFLIYYNINSRD